MRLRSLNITERGLILIALPLVLQIVFVIVLGVMLSSTEEELTRRTRTQILVSEGNQLARLLYDAAGSIGGYSFSGNKLFLDRYDERVREINQTSADIVTLMREDGASDDDIARVQKSVKEGVRLLSEARFSLTLSNRAQSEFPLREMFKHVTDRSDEIVAVVSQHKPASSQPSGLIVTNHQKHLIRTVLVAGIVVSVVLTSILGALFVSGISRRLAVLSENTVRFGAGRPLRDPLGEGDEIANLDRSFHEMANSLEDALQKERAILENALDLICSIDKNGRFQEANKSAFNLLGFNPDELRGRFLSAVLAPDEMERITSAMQEFSREDKPFVLETQMVKADGQKMVVHLSGVWSPKAQLFFCIIRDISELKNIENLKRSFVNMISHDLRSPLTSIKFYFSMLTSGVYESVPEPVLHDAEGMEREVTRLIGLVNNLLDLEKLESGRLDLNLACVSLDEILITSVNSVERLASSKRIKIAVTTGNSNSMVLANADRMVQVFVNLLSNAIKFSPADKSITVTMSRDETNTVIEIKDEGPGIREEDQQRIFDRYEQVKSGAAAGQKGWGLGLAICKSIVDAHKGDIGVRSVPEQGSIFWVRLCNAVADDVQDTEQIKLPERL